MKKYTKQEALSIILECAKNYKENLVDRHILFICTDKHKKVHILEATFYSGNFLHLTGLQLTDEKMSASDFFKHCIENNLSTNHFEFADDGTTDMKLAVLPLLMRSNLSANEIGDFTGSNANYILRSWSEIQKHALVLFYQIYPNATYQTLFLT